MSIGEHNEPSGNYDMTEVRTVRSLYSDESILAATRSQQWTAGIVLVLLCIVLLSGNITVATVMIKVDKSRH